MAGNEGYKLPKLCSAKHHLLGLEMLNMILSKFKQFL